MASSNQKLSQKENGIFKKIVRCYECKQYKNGLKFSRQILSNPRFSEHGETLAMKGLILNCLGRKEEAYEHVKKGLKNDIKSHVCWHVFGLLQRSDKKYEEAIKCYRNALKWDKENVQILRDLSLLQIQMRDLEGFRDTRYQLLKVRPAQRSSWVGYAISYHLLKDYSMALKVMAEYRTTQSASKVKPDYEFSEMVLYEVQLMQEAGLVHDSLKHIRSFEVDISDRLMLLETKAAVALSLSDLKEAELYYRQLVHRNPENYHYYQQLEKCLKLDSLEARLVHYKAVQEQYPRSHVARRMPLTFTSGEVFTQLLDQFLRRSLRKGVPSLFVSIKPLYSDPAKVTIVEELVSGYVESLNKHQKFHPNDPDPEEPPTSLLWATFLLSQHMDARGNSLRALELVNTAIDHTPTDVQLYMLKARIYKHGGDFEAASQWMEEARSLDTADRFVNSKCVRYLLRICEVEQGVETAGLFTREGLPPLQMMNEMQAMWFQTALAVAHRKRRKLGDALQKLHEIEKHFVDIVDDQFDFHTYCMRKMTLRAYVGVLKMEDTLRSHHFYFEAATNAIEIYLYLHDNPSAKSPDMNGPADDESKLSEAERKKRQRKQRKAQLKAQAKEEKEKKENKVTLKQEDDKKSEDKKSTSEAKLSAKELLETDTPLEEAVKFLIPLQTLARQTMQTHLLAYDIHSRRRKFLLMLQAIKRAKALEPENGHLHVAIVDFALAVESSRLSLPDPVREVINQTLPSVTGGMALTELNRDFLRRHKTSLDHVFSGAQVLYRLQPQARQEALDMITDLSDHMQGRTRPLCTKIHQLLQDSAFGECPDVLQSYKDRCHALFPLATVFKSPSSPSTGEPPNKEEAPPTKDPEATPTSESATPPETKTEPPNSKGKIVSDGDLEKTLEEEQPQEKATPSSDLAKAPPSSRGGQDEISEQGESLRKGYEENGGLGLD